jgi:uncharacterized repeat protein (TIGR01451 family)
VLLGFGAVARPTPVLGQGAGTALDFDGLNDVVLVPHDRSLDLRREFTLEAWIYPRAFDAYHTVIHKSTSASAVNYWLSTWTDQASSGFYDKGWREHWTNLSPPLSGNRWYHLVAVFDNRANTYELYVNGIRRVSDREYSNPVRNNLPLMLGDGMPGNGEQFDGRLDEIRIWDRSLSEAEIQAGMNRKITGAEGGLVGYWKFDEGSGAGAGDSSPQGNHGTLTNMTSGDWVLSTAPVGDASVVGAGNANLSETSEVQVDLSWQEGPGAGALFSTIQVNQAPAITTGLTGVVPDRYWELWATDDDGYLADATFHFDGLSGLENEVSMSLFTRPDAASPWVPVGSYSLDTEGDPSDGIGSVTVQGLSGFGQYILIGSVLGVEVSPSVTLETHLPTNGTDETVTFTVTNTGSVAADFDLLTPTLPGTVLTVVSISGPGVTQGSNPDSARISGLGAGAGADVTVTYSANMAPAGTIDTLSFVARVVSDPSQIAEGRMELTLARPSILVGKVANPPGASSPGTDLTYTVTVTNAGNEEAVDLASVDSLPPEIEFQVGSVSNTLPAGVTVLVEFSDDEGSTWTYSPASGGCGGGAGYDRCVNRIRWRFQSPFVATVPDNLASFQYVARIR